MAVVVAAGGVLGSVARYGLSVVLPTEPQNFPWGTFVTNVAGCALLGALLALLPDAAGPHVLIRTFLGPGVLGGFTTFSAFSVESVALLSAGRAQPAMGYVLGTVLAALAGVQVGSMAARLLVRRALVPRAGFDRRRAERPE
ncbi:MAG: fluoride efflux transporter CrcB [Actinomycetota bacterium]|nr:fluoride efflux transporter CrcB [Actinomycetota bacterium]